MPFQFNHDLAKDSSSVTLADQHYGIIPGFRVHRAKDQVFQDFCAIYGNLSGTPIYSSFKLFSKNENGTYQELGNYTKPL